MGCPCCRQNNKHDNGNNWNNLLCCFGCPCCLCCRQNNKTRQRKQLEQPCVVSVVCVGVKIIRTTTGTTCTTLRCIGCLCCRQNNKTRQREQLVQPCVVWVVCVVVKIIRHDNGNNWNNRLCCFGCPCCRQNNKNDNGNNLYNLALYGLYVLSSTRKSPGPRFVGKARAGA